MEAMGEGKHGEFNLPGFRFHPTEEELVGFYLRRKAQGQRFSVDIIETLDLYRFDPWHLPGKAYIGEKEWFFFVPRDKRCPAPRRSRLTVSGYWKATGSDRPIRDQGLQCIGLKKILVFYKGKAPRGDRTDWIMNEYRLPDYWPTIQKDIVLCRIYRKPTSLKTLELRAMADNIGGGQEEEESFEASGEEKPPPMTTFNGCPSNSMNSMRETEESSLNCHHHYYNELKSYQSLVDNGLSSVSPSRSLDLMEMMEFKDNKFKPPELQVPKFSMENFFNQAIVSPWTENTWTPSLWISTPMDSSKHNGNL